MIITLPMRSAILCVFVITEVTSLEFQFSSCKKMAVLLLKPQSTQRKYTQRAQSEDVHSVTQSQRDSLCSYYSKTYVLKIVFFFV